MNSKKRSQRRIALLAIIALAALLLAAPKSIIIRSSWANEGEEPWCGWPAAGTWISWAEPFGPLTEPAIVQETYTPLDPTGERLSYREQWLNGDPTMMGMYPEADSCSDLVGEAVRTGRNTYEYTVIGYGVQSQPGNRGKIQYIWVNSGTLTAINHDTMEGSDIYLSVYGPDKDVNPADGYPDEGAEPDVCLGPMEGVSKRVPLMPPCVPPPPSDGQ